MSARELEVRTGQEDRDRVVYVTGALSVSSTESLRPALIEAMDAGGRVILDASGIQAIDLCGLQLLYAAHRTASAHGVVFELRAPSQALCETARAAGFEALRLM
jgi:anti-anti-sigma factor